MFFLRFSKGCLVELKGGNTIFPSMSDTCTDFYKNASFRPNMLNYLNTTFTFGKQSKDNIINRKFQCRPAYSVIHSFLCPVFLWGVSRGQIPHGQQQSQIVLLAPHQDGTKEDQRCSNATRSLDDLWSSFT